MKNIFVVFVVVVCLISGLCFGDEPEIGQDGHVSDVLSEAETSKFESSASSKPFETHVQRLLDILVHSLYTKSEVFMRELISNAADSLDKLRFLAVKDSTIREKVPDLHVLVYADKKTKTLHIRDTGIGMTKEEMAKNLGTIAQSGTANFLEKHGKEDSDMANTLIGQFGVGFYSAFLVADKATVFSKSYLANEPQAVWESDASGSYKVGVDPRGDTLGRGTEIVLHLREDAMEWLDQDLLEKTISKYAQFISFPIKLLKSREVVTKDQTEQTEEPENEVKMKSEEESDDDGIFGDEDDEEQQEKVEEVKETKEEKNDQQLEWYWQSVNDMQPIWMRQPKNVAEEDYSDFYKSIARTSQEPMAHVHFSAEGGSSFRALLYIPHELSAHIWNPTEGSKKTNSGLRLYVRHVFVSEQQMFELLPVWLRFVVGVVDSEDLPINVGREAVQETKMIDGIKKKLVSKTLGMITSLFNEDENKTGKYAKFYEKFAPALKLGATEDRRYTSQLIDLMLFRSSAVDNGNSKTRTLKEYVDAMLEKDKDVKDEKKRQTQILYLAGSSLEEIRSSPVIEAALKAGREVLYLDDAIDEYLVTRVDYYNKKYRFVNLARNSENLPFLDGRIEDDEDPKYALKVSQLCKWLKKDVLGRDRIEDVVISKKLASSPAVVTANSWGPTSNVERITRSQTLSGQGPQLPPGLAATRILEINPKNPLVRSMAFRVAFGDKGEEMKRLGRLLHATGLVAGGYTVDDITGFVKDMDDILSVEVEARKEKFNSEQNNNDETQEEEVEAKEEL